MIKPAAPPAAIARHNVDVMRKHILTAGVVVFAARVAAQETPAQPSLDVLKKIDQLIEQNRKLEEQNRELMIQINALRQSIASQSQPSPPAAREAVTKEELEKETLPQSPNRDLVQPDDKTLLPEASDGNSAIFGEFNPGRGFTVGKSKYGELNLSGYMVARYLNQLPPDQTATDHLGRPIAVSPRNDFQFHRVMLFSQGWLFSPRFQYSTFLWTVQDTNQVAIGGALSTTNFAN